MTGRLRLTHDGLRLLPESDGEPYRRRDLDEDLGEQYDRLCEAGLPDDRGRVAREARHAVETLRRPAVRMEIEAVVGRTGRRWYAAFGDTHAVVLSPPGIALGPVDATALRRRTPAAGGAPGLWSRPLLLWGLRTEPGDAHALVLDGGATGPVGGHPDRARRDPGAAAALRGMADDAHRDHQAYRSR